MEDLEEIQNHTFMYKLNGDLLVHGLNNFGQLGLGDTVDRYTPVLSMNDPDIKQIGIGQTYSLIYKNNGDLLVCGSYSALDDKLLVPTLLTNDVGIKNIICGLFHIIIHRYNGDILGLGDNSCKQLGLESGETVYVPTLIMNDDTIKKIICGNLYTIIYKKNGDIIGFGDNSNGQFGLANYNQRLIPVPTLLRNVNGVYKISSAYEHISVLKNNGDLVGFNKYGFGKKGVGYTDGSHEYIIFNDKTIKKIYRGLSSLICVKNNGDIFLVDSWCFNNNYIDDGIVTEPKILQISNSEIIKKIIFNFFNYMVYEKNGDFYEVQEIKTDKLKKSKIIINDPHIIMINNEKISYKWNTKLYNFLSDKMKKIIMAFMMMRHIYKKQYNINIVPYIRDMIIGLFFCK